MKISTPKITPEMLIKEFEYSPETGILKRRRTGSIVGSKHRDGYLRVWVVDGPLLAHRIAFAITNRRWPSGELDHINGIKSDNRIQNLREASRSENCRNVRARRKSKTGINGVSLEKKKAGKFRATINIPGKQIHLGYFDSIESAAAARMDAEIKYHGEFSAHLSRSPIGTQAGVRVGS